jgi:hypothetical protein
LAGAPNARKETIHLLADGFSDLRILGCSIVPSRRVVSISRPSRSTTIKPKPVLQDLRKPFDELVSLGATTHSCRKRRWWRVEKVRFRSSNDRLNLSRSDCARATHSDTERFCTELGEHTREEA